MGKNKTVTQSTAEDDELTNVNVKLRPNTMHSLNRLAELTQTNRTQALVNALAVMEIVADTIKAGGTVVLQHKNGSKETLTLIGL